MMIKPNKINLFSICTLLCFSIFLLHPISAAIVNSTSPYVPSDHILLNCGSSSDGNDTFGRTWTADVGSKFAPSSQNTIRSEASTQDSSISQIPYMTARIFRSPFTYTFPVSSGRKFVRLYFYPASYGNFSASNAAFSVSTGGYTLLHNFNASVTSKVLDSPSLFREFSVNTEAGFLNLIFTPNSSVSDAYAFINGIEIVSQPEIFNLEETLLVGLGVLQQFPIENEVALETVFRLNVGGNDISPVVDSGLFRSWSNDEQYTTNGVTFALDPDIKILYKDVPLYIAPENVYATARSMGPISDVNRISNLTWTFTVDSGFNYLVRLHFCEIQANASSAGARVFFIYINEQTATDDMDVFARTKGNGIPLYKDYVVLAATDVDGFQDLSIALHPNIAREPMYYDAFLNGIEIFKLSDPKRNLAGLNPILTPTPEQDGANSGNDSKKKEKNPIPLVGGVVGAIVAVLLIGFLVLVVWRCWRQGKVSGVQKLPPPSTYGNMHSVVSVSNTTKSYTSLPSQLCRHFTFGEIKAATNDFDETLLLGTGGFGKVYKGEIDGGTAEVAIKRGNLQSGQGMQEFQNEIEMLSNLRHLHLVSLIGYCEENDEMILVYDYMAHGTLRQHLYKTQNPPLTWKQRLEICIGAARGLHYLHTGAKVTIIHRDVKTTNILLDDKLVAKVSDFGLSKTGPTLDNTHVSTFVKGSFGYLDPEYYRRQQLTEKSDVYSFGVVLFEVLCARPALNSSLPKEQVNLADWALNCQKKGVLDQIMDPNLRGKIALESFRVFTETAKKCLADKGIQRPGMSDVLWSLEFALELQGMAEATGSGAFVSTLNVETPNAIFAIGGEVSDSRSTGMSTGDLSLGTTDSCGLRPTLVFSEIMDPKGR